MNNEKIAIIGLGITAPEAGNKDQFWQNILDGKNCLSEVPKDRWDWRLYYSEDRKAADKTYSKIGGFIKDFTFNSIKYKIPPQTASQISRLQQITIETVRMALEDSGYDKKAFDPRKAAVVIGNAMGAMRKELTDLRVYKYLNADFMRKGKTFSALSREKREGIIKEYETSVDENILKITEDTMPGELSNVTAGRISNVFNLTGPNMTIDAACASSLAALDYAVLGLRAGKFDLAVAGGADEMMSAPAYVKFCKIGALSHNGSWTFDERANGFVMAEAVAVYILKRYPDAVRDGDRIYALINSVGASSDGKGKGITAPNPKGQKLAIENAFARVDYTPGDVDLIEAHGTATSVGDGAEVEVLKEVFGPHLKGSKKIGLTAIKSQLGHTKAAAGAVSIVKTALALYHKTLPTSINCVKPNPAIDLNIFKVITKAEPWETGGIRRANVSSFGFGGTNFHVTMEEYAGQPPNASNQSSVTSNQLPATGYRLPVTGHQPVTENPKTPFSGLQGETVTFTAPTPQAVLDLGRSLSESAISRWPDVHPMSLFAQPLNAKPPEEWGVSIVAKSPADLKDKIDFLNKNAKAETWAKPPLNFKMKGIYTFQRTKYAAKIGFLFPGQGSQYVDMMRDLAAKYDEVQETFNEADVILNKMIGVTLTDTLWSKPGESREELEKREAAIKQTQMTQPAVMTADMAMFRLLASFAVKPDMVIGHSLGEYAAATAAGVFTLENGLRAVTSRAKEMSNVKLDDPGKMASVALGADKVEKELKKIKGYVICANKNCPLQTVIAGDRKAVEKAVEMFNAMGAQAQEIPVSHAFHSAFIEPAMGPYRKFLENIPIASWNIPILSNVTADYFPGDKKSVYDLLIKQMTSPVEFIRQLERMYADGVRTFIECGPKRVLSAFATATFKDKTDIKVLASNHPKRGGITELNDLLANLTALGFELNWNGKYPEAGGKLFNPYYLNWALQQQGLGARGEGLESSGEKSAPYTLDASRSTLSQDKQSFAAKYGFNFNNIVVSGIAAGTPGTWDRMFREHNIDEILAGHNMIEPLPKEWREKQIEKNVIRVVKSPDGNHRIEKIDSLDQAIKLSARKGRFDIEKEFGLPNNIVKALDATFEMAIAAGVLALKDAGIPLIHYYKKTTTGGWLPEKWVLPESLADETGVIFASAFPVLDSLLREATNYFNYKYRGRSASEMWEIYDALINKLESPKDKQALRVWVEQNFGGHRAGPDKDTFAFSQNFLMKVIPIADSQFAQWVGAKGPAMHISAACASTTQAVHTAECWLRTGKAKRVVIIAADDITNEIIQSWTMPGFLASGTASTRENVSEAALPFDRRRDGLIVGSGAVGMVIEDETLVKARGIKPLARVLATESANSAYHVSRLDTEHVADVMTKFIAKIESTYGLNKKDFAPKTMFMSHETYTPARGGSASAEVKALKRAFGSDADKVIISNVKGFTGHTMGSSLEEVVAVRALNTGIIPPIANYKEPDPELAGINLSKGGKYDFEYALRFAAGFGSHMAMSFIQRVYKEGEPRIEDPLKNQNWLKAVSGEEKPELETVFNTLRIKDKKMAGKPPAAPVTSHKGNQLPVASNQSPVASNQLPVTSYQSTAVTAQTPVTDYRLPVTSQDAVQAEILDMIAEKTGYPKDMLDMDLDMEADLGIDTVKQAELFAAIREHYGITRKENLSLKDYPTIRHCVRFVLDETN
ncbi:MAG: acyltransferase domain-containing protein, partial [Elusimicrobia bacterium]|nr:acyltransferase domain-containing protein [Elusimicrobiota bacterium]